MGKDGNRPGIGILDVEGNMGSEPVVEMLPIQNADTPRLGYASAPRVQCFAVELEFACTEMGFVTGKGGGNVIGEGGCRFENSGKIFGADTGAKPKLGVEPIPDEVVLLRCHFGPSLHFAAAA